MCDEFDKCKNDINYFISNYIPTERVDCRCHIASVLWKVIFSDDMLVGWIDSTNENVSRVMSIFLRYHDSLPKCMQIEILNIKQNEVTFSNGSSFNVEVQDFDVFLGYSISTIVVNNVGDYDEGVYDSIRESIFPVINSYDIGDIIVIR